MAALFQEVRALIERNRLSKVDSSNLERKEEEKKEKKEFFRQPTTEKVDASKIFTPVKPIIQTTTGQGAVTAEEFKRTGSRGGTYVALPEAAVSISTVGEQLPEAVSRQIEREVYERASPTVRQTLSTQAPTITRDSFDANSQYRKITSGTIDTQAQYIKEKPLPVEYTIKNLGFGWVLQKDFYLPTEDDKKVLIDNIKRGAFGNLSKIQEDSQAKYDKDLSEYSKAYLTYSNFPNQENADRVNFYVNRLNQGFITGNKLITQTKDDPLLKSYKYAGFAQKYGTQQAVYNLAGIGLAKLPISTAISSKIATSAPKLASTLAKPGASLVLGSAGGTLYGAGVYAKTGDIGEALFAGSTFALSTGIPGYIDAKNAKFIANQVQKLKDEKVLLSGTEQRWVGQNKVLSSVGGREYGRISQRVATEVTLDSNGNIVSGRITSQLYDRTTNRLINTQNYNLLKQEINQINNQASKLKIYDVRSTLYSQELNKVVMQNTKAIVLDKANAQISYAMDEIKPYIELTGEAEKIKSGYSIDFTDIKRYPGKINAIDVMNKQLIGTPTSQPTYIPKTTNFKKTPYPSFDNLLVPSPVSPSKITIPKVTPPTSSGTLSGGNLLTYITGGVQQSSVQATPQFLSSGINLNLLTSAPGVTRSATPLFSGTSFISPARSRVNDFSLVSSNIIQTNVQQDNLLVGDSLTQPTKQTMQERSKSKSSQDIIQESITQEKVKFQPRTAQTTKQVSTQQQAFSNFTNMISPNFSGFTGGGFSFGLNKPEFQLSPTTRKKRRTTDINSLLVAKPTLYQSQILKERRARRPSRTFSGFELLR